MALILAIESDKRQVNYLTAMVRGKLHAELVLGDTAEGALERLGDRVPDLILTSPLLSPRDEQALGDRLRRLNGVASHVQTLTLPVFAQPTRVSANPRGMLSALLGDRTQASAPDGCDPAVFAEQCKEYLRRSEEERDARRHEEPLEMAPTASAPFESEPVESTAFDNMPVELAPVEPATARDEQAGDDAMVTLDIDLSSLIDEGRHSPRTASQAAEDDEPAVYELSADAIELDSAIASVAAPTDETPSPAAPESSEGDFDDWQNVIDALKRESAQVRVPRERKPDSPTVQTAPDVPAPPPAAAAHAPAAAASPKVTAEPPRRRLRVAQDEWGMFDPAQAGMKALYERLEQITQDEERQ